LPLPPFPVHLEYPALCCMLVFNSLFIVFFFRGVVVGQSVQGTMLVYP
jgi:hypothetical protein